MEGSLKKGGKKGTERLPFPALRKKMIGRELVFKKQGTFPPNSRRKGGEEGRAPGLTREEKRRKSLIDPMFEKKKLFRL